MRELITTSTAYVAGRRSWLPRLILKNTPARSGTPASLRLGLLGMRRRWRAHRNQSRRISLPMWFLLASASHATEAPLSERLMVLAVCVSGTSMRHCRYSPGKCSCCFFRECQACRISVLSSVTRWLISDTIWLGMVFRRPMIVRQIRSLLWFFRIPEFAVSTPPAFIQKVLPFLPSAGRMYAFLDKTSIRSVSKKDSALKMGHETRRGHG